MLSLIFWLFSSLIILPVNFPFEFITGIFTFKDYGLTGDEVFERQTGFYWLNYVLSFTPFDNIKSIAAIKFEEIKLSYFK